MLKAISSLLRLSLVLTVTVTVMLLVTLLSNTLTPYLCSLGVQAPPHGCPIYMHCLRVAVTLFLSTGLLPRLLLLITSLCIFPSAPTPKFTKTTSIAFLTPPFQNESRTQHLAVSYHWCLEFARFGIVTRS
jgi:hypothetical protein